MPLKITLCRKMESNTGTFLSIFHVFTDHNKFRKSKPSCPCISDLGADFEHRQTGWTFIVHLSSEADESRALGYLKLFALFVRSGHCTSESWERTKSHSSIPTDFGSEQQRRMKPFIPSLPLFLQKNRGSWINISLSKKSIRIDWLRVQNYIKMTVRPSLSPDGKQLKIFN